MTKSDKWQWVIIVLFALYLIVQIARGLMLSRIGG